MAALGILLAGCANGKFVTLEAAGKSFPQAEYQVLGKTRYDQTWIDKTIEAEVAGFGFERPRRRPANLSGSVVVVTPATAEKPTIIRAVMSRFKKKPVPVPETKPVVIPAPAVVQPPPTKPVKKHWWQRKKDGQKTN